MSRLSDTFSENNFTIYTKKDCIWCEKAKDILMRYNFLFNEKHLGTDYTKNDLMRMLPPDSRITVPQIYLNEYRIGGHDDLVQFLNKEGITKN